MKEKVNVLGFANGNQTSYKIKFNQLEETVVSTVSGKSLFDFLWINADMIRTIFTDILMAFSDGGMKGAIKTSAAYADKNSYLTLYIAAFIDYLGGNTNSLVSFLGNGFTMPKKGSDNHFKKVFSEMLDCIEEKKAEIKFYIDKIVKDKKGSLPQRFTKYGKESKLFNFDFESFYDADDEVILYPLDTIDDAIRFDIMLMLVNKIKFKPCKCCGEYFIPRGRVNSEYCERIMPGETRPCSEIGALKTFDIVHKNDAIHKAYITAYRRMDSRQRAKLITKDEFKEFGKNARAERKKCYNGEITLEQFQAWLDEFR